MFDSVRTKYYTLKMTEAFGRMLTNYIDLSGQTGYGIAKALGLNPSHINRAASGERNISAKTAAKVANFLEVPDEERARFLLYAVGLPEDEIEKALNSLPSAINTENNSLRRGGFE